MSRFPATRWFPETFHLLSTRPRRALPSFPQWLPIHSPLPLRTPAAAKRTPAPTNSPSRPTWAVNPCRTDCRTDCFRAGEVYGIEGIRYSLNFGWMLVDSSDAMIGANGYATLGQDTSIPSLHRDAKSVCKLNQSRSLFERRGTEMAAIHGFRFHWFFFIHLLPYEIAPSWNFGHLWRDHTIPE